MGYKIIGLVIILILLNGCIPKIETPIVVDDGDVLPENICGKLNNVIVVHKTGCPGCAVALPRLQELEKETGEKFLYYNVAVEKERNELMALGFIPRRVPTIISKCNVYTKILTKEEYKNLLW